MQMTDNHINYVEFMANDLNQVKTFYTRAFGWQFTDYGPEYTAFSESGLQGGFYFSEEKIVQGALVVLYHHHLESVLETVKATGGSIVKDIFSFPGGRRFHFADPSGNELAIWSDK